MSLVDWRNLAIVILAIEALVIVLVIGVVFYIANRGIRKAQAAVRWHAPLAREFLRKAARNSDHVSRKIATPIISAEAKLAQVRRWWSFLRPPIHR